MSAQSISLKTSDGHGLSAYEARPDKSPRGGIVLLQEIFGITGYIRRVSEGYAEHGYHVVAPALFDRVRPGIELTYSKEDAVTGRDLRSKIPWEKTFVDLEAAKARLKGAGKIATLGYCWGGTISWRAAGHIDGIAGAVCYYGTQIAPYTSEQPRCPVLKAHWSKFRSIRPVTASAATKPRTFTRRAQTWHCDGHSNFWPHMSGRRGSATRD